MEDSSAVIP
ncbi:hypothetical protein A2U01_0108758, partial [Trifolium medium]|nr:hypothetical protein [Trifolium medium]MCI87475.1 hypothetical protein [Trifolium medium]